MAGRQLDLLRRARDFRLLFLAAVGSGLGSRLAVMALMVDVWDRTHSGKWVAALLVADFVPIDRDRAAARLGSSTGSRGAS